MYETSACKQALPLSQHSISCGAGDSRQNDFNPAHGLLPRDRIAASEPAAKADVYREHPLRQVDQGTHSECNTESAVGQGQAAELQGVVLSRQCSCPRASPAGAFQGPVERVVGSQPSQDMLKIWSFQALLPARPVAPWPDPALSSHRFSKHAEIV